MTKKILLVDDNSMNRSLFKSLLSQLEYEIHTADGGYAALDILFRHHFDLIVLDWIMPDPDGEFVYKMMRNQPELADRPIIILTGLDSADEIELGENENNAVVIKKSAPPEDILQTVKLSLEGSLQAS